MHFNIVSLFPDFFTSPLDSSLMSKARENELLDFSFYNPRDYTLDKNHRVDDRPFGGGPGMVMQLEPLVNCLRFIANSSNSVNSSSIVDVNPDINIDENVKTPVLASDNTSDNTIMMPKAQTKYAHPALGKVILLTPAGQPFNQAMAQELATQETLTIVCGRYEGFDARIEDLFELCPVSLGDFVLNGGESAALAVVESIARLIPDFMGHQDSGVEESFSAGLLEYKHYTRPEIFEDLAVPELLRGGNHAAIAEWRREESLHRTLELRPDLLANVALSAEDALVLGSKTRLKQGKNLHCALVHAPVLGKDKKSCSVSLTNLDIHDIARSSCTFGLGSFYISTPLIDQQRLLAEIVEHWTKGAGAKANPDRANALGLVRSVNYLEEAVFHLQQQVGEKPLVIGTSAKLPSTKLKGRKAKNNNYPAQISFNGLAELLKQKPALLVFGTGHGLHPELVETFDFMLPPIRPVGYNHLSVRSAVAIILDRILGDWF